MNWAFIVTIAGGVGGAIVALIRIKEWWDRRTQAVEDRVRIEARREFEGAVKDSFIHAVAVNHLPHVFHALELIANHLGIDLPEPPAIEFLPFKPGEERKP